MQDKLIEILSAATGWMTAGDVAEKGGYRSAANVGLGLKNLGERVESRKSKDRKNNSTGHPLVEWKLVEKEFAEVEQAKKGAKKKPAAADVALTIEGEMPTDKECCNAARVVATTAGAEVAALRKQIADLEDDVRRHTDRLQEVSATIVRFLVAAHQLSGSANKPATLHEAEQQIAAAFHLARGRVEELESTIHSMELDAEQSKEVADVAVGYLVKAPKRRPRVIGSPERARKAALSAARQHGRGEVLALVPVGKAIRGAEWKEAA